jgi:FkbM family methyltransferase
VDADIAPIFDAIEGYNPQSSWLFAEIGSRTGDVTRYMHEKYGCRCVGIEPDGEWYRAFRYSVIGLPISAFWGAVGIAEGSAWFQRTQNRDGELGGNIVEWVPYEVVARYEVPAYSWASFLQDCCWDNVPDILFMDCEGAETAIIPQIIEHSLKPKRILIEWHAACYGSEMIQKMIDQLSEVYSHRVIKFDGDPIYGEFLFNG